MQDALKEFRNDLDSSDVGLFFFAGHGMQIDGENYLTAINTDFSSETDAKFSSLPLNKVIEILEKGENQTSLIILDACRNNPYERRWRNIGTQGLAPVFAPKGTLISYATSPGQVAYDGTGDNGAFTSALLNHIDTQNITVEDLFKRVRNTLSASTTGKQTSWEHTSLMGDFFFHTSILTGEFIAEYSVQAIADKEYTASSGSFVHESIRKLRSHNWYTQNPAISSIDQNSVDGSDKDSLFVLGRNIYQSACGSSSNAISKIENLNPFLKQFEKEISFHLLNGMLYEVYFDSSGRFRKRKKTEYIEELLRLSEDEYFDLSFEFIQQALIPHQKQLFYIPGSKRDVLVDIQLSKNDDDLFEVKHIIHEGQDVFYSSDESTLVANTDDDFSSSRTISQIENDLSNEMVVPKNHLKLTYSPNIDRDESLILPYDYNILRFGK